MNMNELRGLREDGAPENLNVSYNLKFSIE